MRFLGFMLLALLSMAISQDIIFEPSFGQNGTTRLENLSAKFVPKAVVDAQGRIILSGETFDKMQTVVRLQANGQLDPSFAVLKLRQLGQVFIDSQDRVLLVQKKQILGFKSNGLLDLSYGVKGVFTLPTGTKSTILPLQKALLGTNDSLWVALLKSPRFPQEDFDKNQQQVVLINISSSGRLNTTFGNKGFISTKVDYPNMQIDAFVKTVNGVAVVSSGDLNSPAGVSTYERPIWIHRFTQNGQLEPAQKTNDLTPLTCTNGGAVKYFAVRQDNTAVFMNSNSGDCSFMYRIWSLDATNQVQPNFGMELPEEGAAVVKSQNGVLLLLDQKISSLKKAILWNDGSLVLHGTNNNMLQIQKISQSGAMDTRLGKKEFLNPFKSASYTLLESKNNTILLVGLENGSWSIKQLAF